METLKQANYASKTESVKNRKTCSERFKNHTSEKLGQRKKIVTQGSVKISEISHTPVQNRNSSTGCKSFCFCTESSQLSSTLSQRLHLAHYSNKKYKT